jgi:hypothetical protein
MSLARLVLCLHVTGDSLQYITLRRISCYTVEAITILLLGKNAIVISYDIGPPADGGVTFSSYVYIIWIALLLS